MSTPTLLFGRLEEFNPKVGPSSAYLEQAEIFFAANSITDDKKVPIFLHAIGATIDKGRERDWKRGVWSI